MDYSDITIVGRLTKEPEAVAAGASGKMKCDLSIAVGRKYKGEETTQFFKATLWEEQALNAAKWLEKGQEVLIKAETVEASAYINKEGKPAASLELKFIQKIVYGAKPKGSTKSAPAQEAKAPAPVLPNNSDEIPF